MAYVQTLHFSRRLCLREAFKNERLVFVFDTM